MPRGIARPETIGGMKFRVVDKVPTQRRGWAQKAIDDFLKSGEKCIAIDFETKQKATYKMTSLRPLVKDEGAPYKDKVKVTRQDATLYFELL